MPNPTISFAWLTESKILNLTWIIFFVQYLIYQKLFSSINGQIGHAL